MTEVFNIIVVDGYAHPEGDERLKWADAADSVPYEAKQLGCLPGDVIMTIYGVRSGDDG